MTTTTSIRSGAMRRPSADRPCRPPRWALVLSLACGLAVSSSALAMQEELAIAEAPGVTAPDLDALDVAAPDEDPREPAEPPISFNFDNAPYRTVVEFFSRESGVPIIEQAAVPEAGMTFISGVSYSFDEALDILNRFLLPHGVRLTPEDNYLYLRSITDAARMPAEIFQGDLPDAVRQGDIVTLAVPLTNVDATAIAEQIKSLVAGYGSVVPVPGQNLLIITETGEQLRRIREVLRLVDSQPPSTSDYRIFGLRSASVEEVLVPLRKLVPEYEKTIVQQGNRRDIIDDVNQPPVRFEANVRSNSIIAIGPTRRLVQAEELIRMLDEGDAAGDGAPTMASFELQTMTPGEASQQLGRLYGSLPEDRRPTIIPNESLGKITIVGREALVLQAEALLGELDPGLAQGGETTMASRVITLEKASAEAIEQTVRRLLSPRQQRVLKYASMQGGRALIVTGPTRDVDAFERLVETFDREQRVTRDVRTLRVERGDVNQVVTRAQDLYTLSGAAEDDPVAIDVDPDRSEVTVVGSRAGLNRFLDFMRQSESAVLVERSMRIFELESARPSELAPRLSRVAQSLLRPQDGSPFEPPEFEPLDDLGQLVVRAGEGQMAAIEGLVQQLDTPAGTSRFAVFPVRNTTPTALLERARPVYNQEAARRQDPSLTDLSITPDDASGTLVVRGSVAATELFQGVLQQVQQLVPPARTTQLIELQFVQAGDIVPQLQSLIENRQPVDPSRRMPPPELSVIERTNTLMVTAEPAQQDIVRQLVSRLDALEPRALPPLKLLQLRAANAGNIARMLSDQYRQRPQADRIAKPVDVRSDDATNTLIVSAHEDLLPDITSFVEELNRESEVGPERAPLLFRLTVAKAVDVAEAMNRLYPQPPIPRDRRGNPMPWLQEPRQVTVSADEGSNSLIIDAPVEMHESLRELAQQLDQVEVPPTAELRTYRVVDADVMTIKRVLDGMQRQGNLSAPPQPGRQAVRVTIEAEPLSGTLIVAGDATTFERVDTVLEDLAAVPVERELAIVPIANADAQQVGDQALSIYNAQVAGVPGAGAVELSIDGETNALQIVADGEALERFLGILDLLQDQVGPPREARLVQLQQADAGEVIAFLDDLLESSSTLRQQGGPDPVFEAIESTNSILIAAIPAQFTIIEQLVRDLDRQQTAERQPLRILRLRTTEAGNIARVLQDSYQRRTPEERSRKPVDIRADAATNTLLVSAHPDVLPEIETIIRQLNESRAIGDEDREIRIFPLTHARAEELAQTIEQMYPEPPMVFDSRGRPRPDLRQPREVVVRGNRATNSLIVDAPSRRLSGFEQIVESLDRPELAGEVTVRTYRPVRADPEAVASSIRELAAAGALGGSPRTPVSVSIEPATRALIVSGPAEAFAQVESVLADLDGAPARAASTVQLYRLRHARADRLEPLLRDLLTTRLREQQAVEGGLGVADVASLLTVSAEPATNTLIISAPPVAQELAANLVEALDTDEAGAGGPVIRVVPLSYGRADQIAPQIQRAIDGLTLPAGGPVRVGAVGGANALVVTGVEADIALVSGLIDELDARPFDPDAVGVQTFELRHADASRVGPVVERLLEQRQQTNPFVLRELLRRDPTSALVTPVRVEADDATNTLLVSGSSEMVKLAEQLIGRLDRPSEDGPRTVLTYAPVRADPSALAAIASRLAGSTIEGGRLGLEITAEPASGTVLVVGGEAAAADAVALLQRFDDQTPAAPAADVAVVNLQHVSAEVVAQTVEPLLSDRGRWPAELVRAERAGLDVPTPTVRADAAANRVIVGVPSALMATASRLIEAVDAPPDGDGATGVRLVRLTSGDAASVADAVQDALRAGARPGQPEPSARAEATSNSVIVTGSTSQLEEADRLIAEMDVQVEPEAVAVRTLRLVHTRAETVAPIIEAMLQEESVVDLLPWWAVGNFAAQFPDQAVGPTVRVLAEPSSNTLVIAAPKPMLELAEQVLAELDRPQARDAKTLRSVRLIALQNADATEVAQNLADVFAGAEGGIEPPTVRVDRGSNALIVRATGVQMAEIESLAGQLDAATLSGSRQMQLIPVDRSKADAAVVAQTLRQLLQQQGGATVEVISLDELLEKSPDAEAEPIAPGSALPDSVDPLGDLIAGAVFAQVAEVDQSDPAHESAQPAITIAVDPATNTLVVVGSPRLTDRLAELASQIQDQIPQEATRVRVVQLPPSADANAIAQLARQTIQRVGRASVQNPGGFTGRADVVPDPAGGSLIIWANDTDFAVLGELIASVARLESSQAVSVRVYPLVNIEARAAAQSVNDLVSAQPTGRQARWFRGGRGPSRASDLTLLDAQGREIRAEVDPDSVRVLADPSGTRLVVSAPSDVLPLIDAFVSLVDQSPLADRLDIRRYPLTNAEAQQLSRAFQDLFRAQRRGPGGRSLPEPSFVADERTNALLVTASDEQHAEIERLLADADAEARDDGMEVAILPLQNAQPRGVAGVLREVLIGRDPGKRDQLSVSADDDAGLLVVRAEPELLKQARELASRMDESSVEGAPIRTIQLETADAPTVARAVQDFFANRAQAAGRGRRGQTRVSIVGERRSGTLIVAASDEDFEQVAELASALDMPVAKGALRVEIVQIRNGDASDLDDTINEIADRFFDENVWGSRSWSRGPDAPPEDRLYTSTHEASNSIVVVGQGETMDLMLQLIRDLDSEQSEVTKKVVRTVAVSDGSVDLNAIARIIRDAFEEVDRGRWWISFGQSDVTVAVDQRRRLLILVGEQAKVERAVEYAETLAATPGLEDRAIEIVSLRHASAERAERTLQQFFRSRARGEGRPQDAVTVIGSADGNALIVSAGEEDMALLRDMVAQIDQPDLPEGRRIEVFALRTVNPTEAGEAIRSMIPSRGRDEAIRVTPQPSRNAIIVSAQDEQFPLIEALLEKLDAESVTPFVSVQLTEARATQVASDLRSALPDGFNVEITAVDRTNTIIVSGGNEQSVEWVRDQIAQLDIAAAPPATEFRRIQLAHADATDVWIALRETAGAQRREPGAPRPGLDYNTRDNTVLITATPDEMAQLVQIVNELDVQTGGQRTTQFVKLEFAEADLVSRALGLFYGRFAAEARDQAAREVTILPDPVTNTLIIAASEEQWEGIEALLAQFDTEAYSIDRTLSVIPLRNADARNVARALNESFRAPLEQQLERERARQEGARRDRGDGPSFAPPPVLIEAEETPVVSAEVETNALIVFANPRDLARIQAIAKTLDADDGARLPDARVIALSSGRATRIAQAVQRIFIDPVSRQGPRSPVVYGDDASNIIVYRGSDADFARVSALVATLEAQGSQADVRVRTLAVRGVPASRLRTTLLNSFRVRAQQLGEGVGVEVDRDTNALVIASSERLFQEMQAVVTELQAGLGELDQGTLDDPAGLGQSLRIVDLQSLSPQQMVQTINQLGLTRQQSPDRPGVVADPITVVPLPSRNAVALLVLPGEADRVEALVRSIDTGAVEQAQAVRLVQLKFAAADQIASVIREMLTATAQQGQPPAARALAEQVRRRSMNLPGDATPHEFDLDVPVQVIADRNANALLVASSEANVDAVLALVETLDTLPVGDAVIARIFPLDNADAGRIQDIVEGLFQRGEAIRRLPGTQRQGGPTTATGQALAGELAIAVDARTNSLIVAGREEAVALVEVLLADLDSEEAVGWIEPRIIALEHADATDLAELLRDTLIDGLDESPVSSGLREQVGRLRMVQAGRDPMDAGAMFDSDLFAALSGVTILPEANTNSLLVVASPANLRLVEELVRTLDVEAAAASNQIRFYTLSRASADRVADIVDDIFDDRRDAGIDREEDEVIVQADLRTNTLVVSTSPRSFAVLDDLVQRLDRQESAETVGLHTLDVRGADVERLASSIERLMRDRIDAATRGGEAETAEDAFSIEAIPATNQLMVVCSKANFEVVRGLVESLSADERRLSEATDVELITLERGSVEQVAEAIISLYVEPENEKRGDRAVSVIPVIRNNALLVSGTEADVERIRAYANQLDVAEVPQTQQLRRVELKSADAREVVRLLDNLLSGRSVAGGAGTSATVIEFRQTIAQPEGAPPEAEPEERVVRAAIDDAVRERTSIEADERTNSVTIMSPPEIMELALAFIDEIDRSEVDDRILEYFALENADAEQMAIVLQELFSLERQGDEFILVPSRRELADDDPLAPPSQQVTPVSTERERLAITIDYRTNTLIVSATQEYLDLVRDVVGRLDSIEATEREEVVYALQNAQADEVERVLGGYVREQADTFRGLLTGESGESLSRILDREVIVVGDPTSNKVLVSASPRYIRTITDIIDELDAAPPQVLVQALIAEVTLDEDATWGLDFDLFDFGGDMYEFAMDATGAGVATAVGLPNLSLTSQDFGLAVRALEGQGRLEVLSRPMIQINNNEVGNLLVGEDIAIIESVDTFESGQTRANVVRRDVGIQMEVRPSISSDGFVRLVIEPEISSLSSAVTQISEDFAAPIINKREVITTVTVRNGETIVIGGLIQALNDDRATRVPLVGQIPVLGWIFRTNERRDVRTELLVVLTPRIIPGGREGVVESRRVTGEQLFRHGAASSKIFERQDVTGLAPESFEGEHPPGEEALRGDAPDDDPAAGEEKDR
ncbi:MAG: secretin N-terminal domain-containing protein [Planctomycetota bacterium]